MPKAQLLANSGQAQDLAVDAYGVVYAAGDVAVPAHQFRFLTAERTKSSCSFLNVRALHVRPSGDDRTSRRRKVILDRGTGVVACFRRRPRPDRVEAPFAIEAQNR